MKKQYFVIKFYIEDNFKADLYVTASSMDRVALWVLEHLSMEYYYGMNIIEVNADKSRKERGDFYCNAVREYYHSPECYGNVSDEVIRQREIEHHKARINGTRRVVVED